MVYVPPKLFPYPLVPTPSRTPTLTDQFYRQPWTNNESDGPSGASGPDHNTPEAVAASMNQTVGNQQKGLTAPSALSLGLGAVPGLGTLTTLAGVADWANKNRNLDLLAGFSPSQVSEALGGMSPEAAAQSIMGMTQAQMPDMYGDMEQAGYSDGGYGGSPGDPGGSPSGDTGASQGGGAPGDDGSSSPSEPGTYKVGGPIPNRGDPRLDPVSITAHEGEFVLNPKAVKKLGLPFLTVLNALGG